MSHSFWTFRVTLLIRKGLKEIPMLTQFSGLAKTGALTWLKQQQQTPVLKLRGCRKKTLPIEEEGGSKLSARTNLKREETFL